MSSPGDRIDGNPIRTSKRPGLRAKRLRSIGFGPAFEGLEDRTVLSFFTEPTTALGITAAAQALGDFNADGKADIIAVSQGASTANLYLGNGDGTFALRSQNATGSGADSVAVGDLNGDGKLDFVTANYGAGTISIFLGNGDGSFQPRTDLAVGATPVSVAVGDFNGDGHPDVAVAAEDTINDYVKIFRGNGDGTFQVPTSIIADSAPRFSLLQETMSTLAVGDFNGDGKPDLAVINNKDGIGPPRSFLESFPQGTLSVLLGNGDGTFQAPAVQPVGNDPRAIVTGDFNGDGHPDIAVANYTGGTVSVLMNAGNGTFPSRTDFLTPGGPPLSLAAGDFAGNGRAGFIVDPVSAITMTVYSGQINGTFQTTTYDGGVGWIVSAGDVNGDGRLDLLGISSPPPIPGPSSTSVLLNSGGGAFPAATVVANPGVTLSGQATADFNGDGIPDRAILGSHGPEVDLGLGDGGFGDATVIPGAADSLAAPDLNGDGRPDLVLGDSVLGSSVGELLNSPGWDNRTAGAVGFTVSAPQQVTAGAAFSVTVTAVDAAGNPVPGFHGTIDFDIRQAGSSQPQMVAYDFTAADDGRHVFPAAVLTRAGAGTIAIFAAAMPSASVSINVVPAATARFVFATPASVVAGTPFSFSLTAEDSFGNVETRFTGTVHFNAEAQDTQAAVPADDTFTAADAGTHGFTATLTRTQTDTIVPSLTATDTATRVTSSQQVNLTPQAAARLSVSPVPSSLVAGQLTGVTVSALDVFGNLASGFADTIHFSSSDPHTSLPADFTFTANNRGLAGFTVTFDTAGTQSLGVTDTTNPAFAGTPSGIVVVPAAPTTWVFTGLPASSTAGVAQSFTLTAFDPFGNVATNYLGRVHFTSSDGQAALPADHTFTTADAGSHTFTAALKTAGTQSITVTDTANSTFTGSRSLAVTPATAASLSVAGFPATTAGVAQTSTITLRDAFGNVATGYRGTVAVTSSDPLASLPASYSFTAADAGVHTFSAALKKAGTQSITVLDTAVPALASTQSGIAVTAAAVSQFAISGPTSVTQGVGFKITVSAEDAFGNVNAGYRGSVHLSSTDPTGGTQNFTFSNNDNGVHVFSYTFNALGAQAITIVDTINSAILGTFITNVMKKT